MGRNSSGRGRNNSVVRFSPYPAPVLNENNKHTVNHSGDIQNQSQRDRGWNSTRGGLHIARGGSYDARGGRQQDQGTTPREAKTPNGENFIMADRIHNYSSHRRHFNHREEEGILSVAETAEASFEEIVDAITTLRKSKHLGWSTDILHPSRLALCSNCQNLAFRLSELDNKQKRFNTFDWHAPTLRRIEAAHYSPASPPATPAVPPSPNTPKDNMESPIDFFMELVSDAVKNRNQNAIVELFQIRLLDLPEQTQNIYSQIQRQLQDRFQKGSEDRLSRYCKKMVSKQDTGDIWSSFISFVKDYLVFLRDFIPTEAEEKQNLAGARLAALREPLAVILAAQG